MSVLNRQAEDILLKTIILSISLLYFKQTLKLA